MRIVCDTNVLVRAIISPAGPAAELLGVIAREHSLVTSLYVLDELYDVLRRPQISRLHGLDIRRVQRVISRFYKLAAVAPLPPDSSLAVSSDPKDNAVVLTAVLGSADVLCTLDRHLFEPAVVELCAGRQIRVLRDAELLAELRPR